MAMDANVRESAVESFNREWSGAFDAGVGLERAFGRLSAQMASLAGAGLHMHIEFKEPLQTWWVAYRERAGDLIPRHPEDAPIMALEQ